MPTVTVACKHPNGLILRTFEPSTQKVPVLGGGFAEEKVFKPTGNRIAVKGPAHRLEVAPNAPISSGYALTYGVDADLWAKWYEQNKESPLVRNGVVFAHEKQGNVEAETREKRDVKTGFEPVEPKAPSNGVEAKKD